MKKIRARTVWIIVGILFLIAVGLIFAVQYTNDVLNKVCLVALIITFILITILIQLASFKSFSGMKNIKYPEKEFKTDLENLEYNLVDLGYKQTKKNFGNSYLLIDNKHAYKISFIDSSVEYFSNTKEEKSKPNKELDKCETFMGIEIFNQIDDINYRKLTEFTIQTKNIYYTAFAKTESGNYRCLNYEEPNDTHRDCFLKILEDLHFKENKE